MKRNSIHGVPALIALEESISNKFQQSNRQINILKPKTTLSSGLMTKSMKVPWYIKVSRSSSIPLFLSNWLPTKNSDSGSTQTKSDRYLKTRHPTLSSSPTWLAKGMERLVSTALSNFKRPNAICRFQCSFILVIEKQLLRSLPRTKIVLRNKVGSSLETSYNKLRHFYKKTSK